MTGRGIDHVGIATRSLDGLARQWEALGFTLTPRAYHPDHMGTSNRLVQFGGGAGAGANFIELIEVDRPDGIAAPRPGYFSFGHFAMELLERREAMCLIVLRTDDRDADLAAWRGSGLQTYAPFDFQRQATLPDGSQQTVRFELGFVTSPAIPDVIFFVCHNRAQEHFWKPEFQAHANGGEEIEAIVLVADDPTRHGDFLSALFGGAVTDRDGGISVAFAEHRIDVVRADALADPEAYRPPAGQAAAVGLRIRAPGRAGTVTPAAQAGGVYIEWVG